MKMNLNVTEVPFGSGAIEAHLDTSEGAAKLELGHIQPVDLTVTLDYATAKAILVEGNPSAGMQAFMAGRIKVDGDMSKLMALQGAAPDATATEVATRLRQITE
jgi:putative sterol carrier protein